MLRSRKVAKLSLEWFESPEYSNDLHRRIEVRVPELNIVDGVLVCQTEPDGERVRE